MKVAVCRYPVAMPADMHAFAARLEALLTDARAQGARLAVLPEYLALELAASFAPDVRADLKASLAQLQPLRGDWIALFTGLARRLQMHILAGSFLLEVTPGRYRNRSDLFTADGGHCWQDKLQLTGFEKRSGVIEPGEAVHVMQLDDIRVGIAVCYDCEFPLPVRAQREAGMQLLLVPSCTDTDAGATRVRVGCLARALENRIYVAQAVTAGEARWSPALDVNTGQAALLAPMDVGLPADGILAQTEGDACWALATLDFAALEVGRAQAQVANDLDWPGQNRFALRRACLQPPVRP
ncbi:carbon-nitrogen hydrolase family protein [Thermomonas hydrothermalis]|uniref:Predicted amidohydrolase n=1 Tax=Thermomonas hydrothermalis TaxID=213588 RepID=A0A1M4Y6E3_9GAMM|nr:carbon-nitrogen hydrolase family protein [Thermomonas hydrothermalis]SHF01384.1 Predicted amidohydrolase [Thermomonas hydrothermalis]